MCLLEIKSEVSVFDTPTNGPITKTHSFPDFALVPNKSSISPQLTADVLMYKFPKSNFILSFKSSTVSSGDVWKLKDTVKYCCVS